MRTRRRSLIARLLALAARLAPIAGPPPATRVPSVGRDGRRSPRGPVWRVRAPVVVLCVVALLAPASPALANPGTWTGNGINPNWTNGANWFGGAAPAPGEALDFPAGALQLTNNDDFPLFTSFNAFTFEQGGYTLGPGGSAVTLTAGITASNVSGTNTINLGLQTTGAQT